jgi:hypothetical protein
MINFLSFLFSFLICTYKKNLIFNNRAQIRSERDADLNGEVDETGRSTAASLPNN